MGLYNDGIPDDGIITKPRKITTPKLLPGTAEHLRKHGCAVVEGHALDEITYPIGSHFKRKLPYISGPIYWVTLPDGYHVHEQFSSTTMRPMISLPDDEFEDET